MFSTCKKFAKIVQSFYMPLTQFPIMTESESGCFCQCGIFVAINVVILTLHLLVTEATLYWDFGSVYPESVFCPGSPSTYHIMLFLVFPWLWQFLCFWGAWLFWGGVIRYFVHWPSVSMFLMFYSWLVWSSVFWEGRPQWCSATVITSFQHYIPVAWFITDEVYLHHLTELIPLRCLHCKLTGVSPLCILSALEESHHMWPTPQGKGLMLYYLQVRVSA